jgi:type VI protein secretion system component Hcp
MGTLSGAEEIEYFINVPGTKGEADRSEFAGWIKADTLRYRIPGIAPAYNLMKSPPEKLRGLMLAKDIEKAVCSFSKPLGKADKNLYKGLKKKQLFQQWQITLCNATGKPFMNFLFKSVTISGISKRDKKQYVTFQYERVVWNYIPMENSKSEKNPKSKNSK